MYTYQDAIDELLDFSGAESSTRELRFCKRSIQDAYREIANVSDWTYYTSVGRINTVAPYSTGTVSYATSGRALTLATGTWPAWAKYGSVLIGTQVLDIYSVSGAVATITHESDPGIDIASTAYTLYRDVYPTPQDFISCSQLISLTTRVILRYCAPQDELLTQRFWKNSATSFLFTVTGDRHYQGQNAFLIAPPPNDALTYDFQYIRRGRPLLLPSYSAGTVTTNGSTAVVTGSGTTFTQAHVGCVYRHAANGTAPTGLEGDNPYVSERIVKSVETTGSLTLDDVPPAATGVSYVLSDPVDMDLGGMLNAFKRCVEKHVAQKMHRSDQKTIESNYQQALLEARGVDNAYSGIDVAGDDGTPAGYRPMLRDFR